MTRPKTTIYKESDLNLQLKCQQFKDLLAEWYGKKSGAIKAFCRERGLNTGKVYRQLSGFEILSDELLNEMDSFKKEKGL